MSDPNPIDPVKVAGSLPVLVPIDEVAKFFGVSRRTVKRWRAQGRLRAFKTAPSKQGRCLFPRDEIVRLLEEMLDS